MTRMYGEGIRRVLSVLLLPCLALTLFASSAAATSVQQLELQELVEHSALIVRATVVGGASYAEDRGDAGLCTPIELEVKNVLKGTWPKAEAVEFCLPGGLAADGKVMMVIGAAMPELGETYILFLHGGDWHYTPFVNVQYGALREGTVEGRQTLITGNGRCVAGVGATRVELADGQVAFDDQIRHLQTLGVPLDTIDEMPGGRSRPVHVGGGQPSAQERGPRGCGQRGSVMQRLRQAINDDRNQNGTAGRPSLARNHTPVDSMPPGAERAPSTTAHPRLGLEPEAGEASNRSVGPQGGE